MTKTSFVKQKLRVQQLKLLREIPEEDKTTWSRKIIFLAQQNILWKEARSLVAFLPFSTEPRILPLLDLGLAQNKSVFIPSMSKHEQGLQCYDSRLRQRLQRNSFRNSYSTLSSKISAQAYTVAAINISYQAQSHSVLPFPILILVPGLMFSCTGCRLGRGWAFYDRLLAHAQVQTWKLGLCYDMQIAKEQIPQESHDICMQYLLSESGLRTCTSATEMGFVF